ELHLALSMLRLAVRKYPDVRGDAGVVEDVERQRNDGLQPVVLQNPSPNVALSLAGVAGKERGPVVHLCDPASAWSLVLHLGELVYKKHQLPVAGTCDKAELRITVV